jgi:ribonuclease Y
MKGVKTIKPEILTLLLIVLSGIIGISVGLMISRKIFKKRIGDASKEADKILSSTKKQAEQTRKEARIESKEMIYQARSDFEKETKEVRSELQQREKRLTQKEENIEKRFTLIEKKELDLKGREKGLQKMEKRVQEKEDKYNKALEDQIHKLERISGMSSEEAKRMLMQSMEEDARYESAKIIKRILDEARENAEKEGKNVIALAIQRCAADYTSEITVSVVNLPNDEMKGRIIGREGRNIRSLESATGIDLIIDDTPEAVILSGYNPIRREVARISLERLVGDGRIHPARIEEVVNKVQKEVDQSIKEEGEKTSFDVGVHTVHPEVVKLIGRLKYRTSYGQNVLNHSKEVAYLCGVMASELKLDETLAKRAGLLHDIGKAVDHEVEGTHAAIGSDLARKYGEDERVINAIASHHDDVEAICPESVLVAAADALSAARPGARKESLDAYVKRLTKLEEIANAFGGVEKSYAIQAGREIRIIVENEQISDDKAAVLVKEICKKIEQELTYPGKIKVTVIRESRYVEYAK